MDSAELFSSGFIILDKWRGPTSRDVSSSVRKLLGISKAAHIGTLDPGVSGVLPILLGDSCKVMPALQRMDKEYVGAMRIHKDVAEDEIRKAFSKYVGKIRQTPPVRSAVARKERTREISSLNILEIKGRYVLFSILCESGTYVRSLCHSIGQGMGVGAQLVELRRTRVGPFSENDALKMQELALAYLDYKEKGDERIFSLILPVEKAVEHTKKIVVKDTAISSILNGSPLYSNGIASMSGEINKDDMVTLFSEKGRLVALGKAANDADGIANSKKSVIAAKVDRVIMRK